MPRALRNPRQKSGLHPSGLIQLPLVSPAPKDHPHGKSQSPIHRVQADAQETWDKFSFLGKLAAPRSPPPPSSRPPLLLVSSTQTAGGLGGFTFGALQSRGPSVPTAGWVAGCRTGARQRELWRALQRTKESVPPPKPDPAPSLVPAQARLCRSQPPATAFPPRRAFDLARSLLKRQAHLGWVRRYRVPGWTVLAGYRWRVAGARGGCREHSVGTSVGSLRRCNLPSPGPGAVISCGETETERPSGVCEMRELKRVALTTESRPPFSVPVVLNHKSDSLAPLLKVSYNVDREVLFLCLEYFRRGHTGSSGENWVARKPEGGRVFIQ